jgi:putative endopeptidase
MRLHVGAVLLVVTLCTSCAVQRSARPAEEDFLAANVDPSVSPGEDFYTYATGTWLKRNPIPADEGSWGIGNLVLAELDAQKRRISEKASTETAAQGSISQLIGDFWFAGMDTTRINEQGLAPLQSDFDTITRIRLVDDLIDYLASLHASNMRGMVFFDYVGQDEQNSDRWIYRLGQGRLSMPALGYYTNTDPNATRVRSAFQQYLFRTFRRLGDDSSKAATHATAAFNLELRLSRASGRGVSTKISFADLQSLTPSIDWHRYLRGIGLTGVDTLDMTNPKFFSALNAELQTTPLEDWKNYLRFRVVDINAPFLDRTTVDNAAAYSSAFTGQVKPRPRWRTVLAWEGGLLGDPLAQLVATDLFTPRERKRYNNVFETIREAFRVRIEALDWMSESTKRSALAKLSRLKGAIGYPNRWTDYSSMTIRRDALVLNMLRGNQWVHQRMVDRLHGSVDKTEWSISGTMRDAYYSFSNNEIRVESGSVIAPGLKDDELDDAFVYGYTFIGHEISHGFDLEGRHYDASGNRVNWWTGKDSLEFLQRANAIVAEYNEFVPLDSLRVNGQRTASENIADLGGVLIALDAFKKTEQFRRNEKIGGFTPLQRFFLAFAYRQMGHRTKAALASQIMEDYHAPDKERVNGVVVNIPEFYEAFGVKPGDRMYRPEHLRAKIW